MAEPGKKLDRSVFVGDIGPGPLFPKPSAYIGAAELPTGFDPGAPEDSYRLSIPEDHRKRFGQFFTPQPVAELMCKWVLTTRPSELLDPATGPGIFVREVLRQTEGCEITAVEIDPLALAAARRAIGETSRVRFALTDFLTWNSPRRFDAALANPPYLKHHNFHYNGNIFAEIGRRNGVHLSRLTNIYVLFILEICRRLKPGGRAAIIVPGEWVNANFGMPLKRYLLGNGLLKALLYFSHHAEVFGDALTTASVLLIDKPGEPEPVDAVLTAYVSRAVNVRSLAPLSHSGGGSADPEEMGLPAQGTGDQRAKGLRFAFPASRNTPWYSDGSKQVLPYHRRRSADQPIPGPVPAEVHWARVRRSVPRLHGRRPLPAD